MHVYLQYQCRFRIICGVDFYGGGGRGGLQGQGGQLDIDLNLACDLSNQIKVKKGNCPVFTIKIM